MEARLKEAEKSLLESREELALMLSSIADGVIATDARGCVTRMNRAAEHLTGWSAKEATGLAFEQVFEIDSKGAREPGDNPVRRALRSGQVEHLAPHCALISRDGTRREIGDSAAPIFDTAGRSHGVVMVFRDKTAEATAVHAMEESQDQLKGIFENITDFVMMVDAHGLIQSINRVVPGYTREQLIGSSWLLYIAPTQQPIALATFEQVLATGEHSDYETSTPSPDGGLRWFLNRIGPMRRDAAIIGAVILSRDVTERKITEAKLMVSDRMASVGMLAAGVAHEINNPLASIITNLALAQTDLTAEAQKRGPSATLTDVQDSLHDASESARRIRDIVHDLKIFSRNDVEATVPVDVHRVLDSMLRMASNEIRHRARLVKDFGQVPRVEAVDSRLGQVFLNLLVNAAQSIKEGRADNNEIRVTTRTDEEGRAVIEISDTGSGIAPELLGRLFTPFFTTKPVGEGTGLGLSICHRIIVGLGGSITVKSEPGHGTVMRVTLLPARLDAPIVEVAPASAPAVAAHRGKILVIDDEVVIAKALQRTLSREHDVDISTRAADALTRIRGGERFDVILCDLMMPEITGMDLYLELLKVDEVQARRIIFLSGGAFTPTTREFLERVPNLRLDKPFDMQNLRALINDRIR